MLLQWSHITFTIESSIAFFQFPEPGSAPVEYSPDILENCKKKLDRCDVKGLLLLLPGDSRETNSHPHKKDEALALLLEYFDSLTLPSVAVISGKCRNSYLEIALVSTMRICCEDTAFIFPADIPCFSHGVSFKKRLSLLLGRKALLGTANFSANKVINAKEASEFGLVNRVFTAENIVNDSLQFFYKIVRNRPIEVIKSCMIPIHYYKYGVPAVAYEEELSQFCQRIYDDYQKENYIER